MFERTNCKHPIIVLKDIKKDDLEALLNYMYVGEVNVLQNNLSGLIKAAEGLRIKGLAVPDESPSETEVGHDNKRSVAWGGEGPEAKRRRPEESSPTPTPPRPGPAPAEKGSRERSPVGYRDPFRTPVRSREPVSSSPISIPPSPETTPHPPLSIANTDPPPDLSHAPPPPHHLGTSSKLPPSSGSDVAPTTSESTRPPECEMKSDEPVVKEEPQETYSETEDSKEPLGGDSDGGINYSHHPGGLGGVGDTGTGNFSPGLRAATQPQTLEDLVALPGASGLQGKVMWEGDRTLMGIPFESYSSNQVRATQMGPRCSNQSESLEQTLARAIQSAHVCPVCGHLARQKKDLKKHLRVHTGEKPYACPWCAYRSTQNSNLRTHIRRVHTQHLLQSEQYHPPTSREEGTATDTSCPPLFVD
ncbi:hypothetical protein Pmani_005189 [Petrolisthes manimaculis]|uniref:Fruitless n=1 Tax=Petrolisthes manimaculis TaxID=1843537 RepID=A0AAE1QF75_9EUCA|nr:hypothetical protein Pmani_005189 [Petrolisthes manimaculis]